MTVETLDLKDEAVQERFVTDPNVPVKPFSTYELVTLGFWSSLRAIFRGARIELYQRVK